MSRVSTDQPGLVISQTTGATIGNGVVRVLNRVRRAVTARKRYHDRGIHHVTARLIVGPDDIEFLAHQVVDVAVQDRNRSHAVGVGNGCIESIEPNVAGRRAAPGKGGRQVNKRRSGIRAVDAITAAEGRRCFGAMAGSDVVKWRDQGCAVGSIKRVRGDSGNLPLVDEEGGIQTAVGKKSGVAGRIETRDHGCPGRGCERSPQHKHHDSGGR